MKRTLCCLAASISILAIGFFDPALAGRGDKTSRAMPTVRSGNSSSGVDVAGFRLRSRILANDPGVAADIDLVRSQPNDPLAWRSLGTTLAQLGAFDDAIAALERAVDLDRDDADSWVDLGAAQVRSGNGSRSVASFQRALKIEPFHGRGRYNLGLAYEQMDRYDDALDEYELALVIDPSLGDPRVNPSAANNPLLPIVKLRVYMRTAGSASAIFTLPEPE
ncbi:MAG: tetratricopeptide repeat protein [Acidobacteriota bacterium]|nr:tetratricopeptide repeat protein [Acidobacteriota bacterium]